MSNHIGCCLLKRGIVFPLHPRISVVTAANMAKAVSKPVLIIGFV